MRRGKRGPQQRCSQGRWIVDDDLWAVIEPLPPVRERPVGTPGRKPLGDRKALCGILSVLDPGLAWQWPTQALGFRSGMSRWRRLKKS